MWGLRERGKFFKTKMKSRGREPRHGIDYTKKRKGWAFFPCSMEDFEQNLSRR